MGGRGKRWTEMGQRPSRAQLTKEDCTGRKLQDYRPRKIGKCLNRIAGGDLVQWLGSSPHRRKRSNHSHRGPLNFGWSTKIENSTERRESESCESEHPTLSLATREERSDLANHSDSSELSEERESNPSPSAVSFSSSSSPSELTLVTRQQSADLLAAHLRWGHRSFRRCAQILGIPSTSKSPFCVACVEAKASRHPRSARGGHN